MRSRAARLVPREFSPDTPHPAPSLPGGAKTVRCDSGTIDPSQSRRSRSHDGSSARRAIALRRELARDPESRCWAAGAPLPGRFSRGPELAEAPRARSMSERRRKPGGDTTRKWTFVRNRGRRSAQVRLVASSRGVPWRHFVARPGEPHHASASADRGVLLRMMLRLRGLCSRPRRPTLRRGIDCSP